MNAYQNFRVFYNQAIYPELFNLERRRKKLVASIAIALLLIVVVLVVLVVTRQFELFLLALLPVGFTISRVIFHIQVFYGEYKPRVVKLILDFFDNDVNYRYLDYQHDGHISKEKFLASRIFNTPADEFVGEDYISGRIREMPFELSELRVGEISPVRNQVDTVFRGIMCIGDFLRPEMNGVLLVLPDSQRKHSTGAVRAINLLDGKRVKNRKLSEEEKKLRKIETESEAEKEQAAHLPEAEKEMTITEAEGNAKKKQVNADVANDDLFLTEFEATFDTYCSPQIPLRRLLSYDMQRAILQFQKDTGQTIYVSVVGSKVYVAVSLNEDLLDPHLLRNVVDYQAIQRYYYDLDVLFGVIKKMDVLY